MATTEDEDLDVGKGSGDAEQDYLRVASVLHDRLQNVRAGTGDGDSALTEILEIAAQEFGIERDDRLMTMKRLRELRETSMGSGRVESCGRCTHSCSDHKEVMNPKLWENLPREVLQIVFAHLPLGEISCLKLLSKEWQQIISSADFHRVCSEVYPRLVCLITRNEHDLFWVRVLDHFQKWHTYKIHVAGPLDDLNWRKILWSDPQMHPACEDQGWVCFVTEYNLGSKKKKAPPSFFFNVVNLLTRSSHELPHLFNYSRMNMVRIHVDRTTKAFKVFACAERVVWTKAGKWINAGVASHVYDSLTEEWRTTDIVLADRKRLEYDFENGRLFNLNVGDNLRTGTLVCPAFYKGRLFLLQLGSDGPANDETANQSPMYYIEEFHWETDWVKVKSHRCEPFEHPPKNLLSMHLHACNGFLMVIIDGNHRGNERFGVHLAWLYDLLTGRWSLLDLPQLPVGRRTYDLNDRIMLTVETPGGQSWDDTYNVWLMCEPQWAV